jgi:hypothetical protein
MAVRIETFDLPLPYDCKYIISNFLDEIYRKELQLALKQSFRDKAVKDYGWFGYGYKNCHSDQDHYLKILKIFMDYLKTGPLKPFFSAEDLEKWYYEFWQPLNNSWHNYVFNPFHVILPQVLENMGGTLHARYDVLNEPWSSFKKAVAKKNWHHFGGLKPIEMVVLIERNVFYSVPMKDRKKIVEDFESLYNTFERYPTKEGFTLTEVFIVEEYIHTPPISGNWPWYSKLFDISQYYYML